MDCEKNQISKNGKCCNLCKAGYYVLADCTDTAEAKCGKCEHGSYTATENYLSKCQKCKECNTISNKKKILTHCSAEEDTVCECVDGYYCEGADCGHCVSVTSCDPGFGVEVRANRTTNARCAPCRSGTYSNVTDHISTCQPHTSCDKLGRVLEIPGTETSDAICGDFKSNCHWILPASLWAGFALTTLIVFCLILYKMKYKSHRAGMRPSPSVPVTLVEVSATPICPLELPLKSTELTGHCQESCAVEDYKLPLFDSDEIKVCCSTQDSMSDSIPITPLKASVSFAPNQINGSPGHCNGTYLRTYSEPQEDEWCGT